MKALIPFLFLVISPLVYSSEMYKMIDRDQSFKLVEREVSAEELGLNENTHSFESFLIYKSVNNEPVNISVLNGDEKIRVATLAYHLKKARNYFISVMKEDYLKTLGQIGIRYDMARGFSPGRHFTKEDSDSNNAVTHKPSNTFVLQGVQKWGHEIWFRPSKDEEGKMPKGYIGEQMKKASGGIENDLFNLADSYVIDVSQKAALGISPQYVNQAHYASELELILLLKEILPDAIDLVASNFSFTSSLDSAMVPEIIYHEFTHVALSDYVPLTGSFSVSEGIANYFAAIISGHDEIAGHLGKYGNNVSPISINKKFRYSSKYELNDNYAHHPFTYNFLWKIRDRVSKEIKLDGYEDSALAFDQIVFESRKYIDLSSEQSITKSLTDALLKATGVIITDRVAAREVRLMIRQTAVNVGM